MKLLSLLKGNGDKTLEIGGGAYTIKIPKKYLWEYDKEGTLLFYPKGIETITIRVSVISFTRKDGKKAHGSDYVLEDAKRKGFKYEVVNDGIVLSEEPPKHSTEGGTDLVMQFWYLGRDNSLFIFSSTTLVFAEKTKEVKEMNNSLLQIIKSVSVNQHSS